MKPLVLLLLLWSALAQAAAPPDLDAWVERAMKAFEVPGAAVAIVKDGRVEAARGYGVRRLGAPAGVDADTQFGVASNTKAFTAAALAILVEEKKLAWDDPVQKHLPAFQLYDPYASREVTVRDLLCHRAGLGLGAGDLLFWPDTDVTRAEVVAAARFIRPASSFRSRYAYNNLMFVVAGEVVTAVAGKTWDDFVRERILVPIGMTRTVITSPRMDANAASPHSRGWRLEGQLTPIPPTRDETWAAAAGLKSSASDMAKWVAVQLDGGRLPNGDRLWSEAASREMWSSHTIQTVREPAIDALKAAQPSFAAYGLGWDLRDYRGRKVVSHGGGLTGMVTRVMMVPDAKLGVVVLTNQEEGGALSAIAYRVLDHYLGHPPSDWIAAYVESRKRSMSRAAEAEKKQESARARGTRPSLELSRYARRYRDPWYGGAEIAQENGRLVLRMSRTPAMVADLEHWHYDTFKAVFRDKTIPDAFVTFALDRAGAVEQMRMQAVSELADFSFDYHDLLFRPVVEPASASAARAIEIWHGDRQRVGHLGDAQDDFNLMGTVRPWREIDRLTWRQGKRAETPLSFRAFRRLVADGDFNADIPIAALDPGPNEITITARFRDGAVLAKTVTLVKEDGSRPLPVRIRWREVKDPQEVGQYVDGKWGLTESGLRTRQTGYDRVFLIGERNWQDYEVRTSMTLHEVTAETTPVSGGNGVGVILRFTGHVTGGPRHFASGQPKFGYQPFGAIGWLRWTRGTPLEPPHLQFYPGDNDRATNLGTFPVRLNEPYALLFRCETLPDAPAGRGVTRYSFKIWNASGPEPRPWAWRQVQQSAAALRQGGVALLAHHADVTFGDVEITPVRRAR